MDICEQAYRSCKHQIDDDFDSYESFLKAVDRLDRSSSPGYPYCKAATTNGQYLGWDGLSYNKEKVDLLWGEVYRIFESRDASCIHRLFLKMEPLSKEKIEEGRYRIIIAAPLPVQIAWHMVFDKLNDLEIDNTYLIPSQQGLIIPNGGWKVFLNQWKSKGYDTGLDKRAWDWNAPIWLIRMCLRLRTRLATGRRLNDWIAMATELYRTTFEDVTFIISDGTIFHQDYPGVMKSGSVVTISDNSHMQVFVHIFACEDQGVSIYPLPSACGDDTLQKKEQAVDIEVYSRYGAIVKSASDGLEFVGHEFLDSGPVPLYFDKHITMSFHVRPINLASYFDSMCRMYTKSPLFDFWVLYAQECGVYVMSRAYYDRWFDFAEITI